VCTAKYSNTLGYSCAECQRGTAAAVITLLVVLVAVAIACVCCFLYGKTGLSDGQDAGASCFAKVTALPWSKLRIPIVVIQITTQFFSITGLPIPDIYRHFLSWLDVLNLDLSWALSLGCVLRTSFYQRLLINTLSPLVIASLLMCSYGFIRHRNKVQVLSPRSSHRCVAPQRTSTLNRASATHCSMVLAMTFLIYSTVSTTIFQTFACDSVDDDAELKAVFLRADYSVQCGTHVHMLYKVYAGVMIILYPIGIPVLYIWLLKQSRHMGYAHGSSKHIQSALSSTGFLWRSYTSRMYYWEVVECMRRLLLTGAIVFIAPGTSAQAAVACLLAMVSAVLAVYCKPHIDALDGKIYTVGAINIFMSMFLSLAMKSDVSRETQDSQASFAIVLIILNVGIVAVALIQMCLVGCRTLSGASQKSPIDDHRHVEAFSS
jgi:hypothetical protein